ncbi:MAG TPA: ROK family protein [Rhizomicrobium sp.]|nr:ROK family protein [Rhizomicrobium sp.]
MMRIGVDLGGTKIEAVALDDAGVELFRERVPTPRHDYDATIEAVVELSRRAAGKNALTGIGVAIPGCVSKLSGLIKNANSTWLNGRALGDDLAAALHCRVALTNDANCFVLSEATDGAGAGADVVFGVIAGTGVGGGICVHGKVLEGPHGLAGEWGHNPLPWMSPEEWTQAPACYCGKRGCIETWISGPALAADYARHAQKSLTAEEIAASNEAGARAAMARFTDRFARSLASVVNILDPDVIVLGGGLSNIESLYRDLPPLVARYAFTIEGEPKIVKNRHGDSSGVRGAAWLAPS